MPHSRNWGYSSEQDGQVRSDLCSHGGDRSPFFCAHLYDKEQTGISASDVAHR